MRTTSIIYHIFLDLITLIMFCNLGPTNDGRCTCEIKCRISMAKAVFNKKKALFTSTLDSELRKKLVKCYIWSIALYGAETWTLRAVDQKHLESFEIWCWRRMEKISWTDHVRNEEVLLRFKKQRNILHEISKRKANSIGHILHRNCLLKRVIERTVKGRIEVTGRRGRRVGNYGMTLRKGEDILIWRRKL